MDVTPPHGLSTPAHLEEELEGEETAQDEGEDDEENASARVLAGRSGHPGAGVEGCGVGGEEDHGHH